MVPAIYNGSPSPQVLVQFLNNVLSQRGPSALPYNEDVKWFIRQHLIALVQEHPSLQVKTATFTHNDGRAVNLLQADGTIPMLYNRVTYNIPVIIWLIESYPRQSPSVYLNPARDMIIRRSHPLVSASGLVSVPYLQNWVFPSSNLLELVRHMGHLFGQDPPLYTRTPASSTTPRPSPPPSSSSSSLSRTSNPGPLASSASSSATPFPDRLLSPYFHAQPTQASPHPPRPVETEDPSEIFKKNAINKLVRKLHSDTVELRKSRESEMDSLFNVQAALRRREEEINKSLSELRDEKEGLEQLLQIVLMNSDVVEEWVKQNGDKKKRKEIDVDDLFQPADALSRQMLECTAADSSIEDAIYSLEKAIQEGLIPFDAYMRNVRALSREQFFHRATAAKVRSAQLQAHVASMASRVSYGGA